jgi:hypothetical protein
VNDDQESAGYGSKASKNWGLWAGGFFLKSSKFNI